MILVTGGAGYIGSHTVVELLLAGEEVVVLDNLANSSRSVLDRVAHIAGRCPIFVEGDVRDRNCLDSIFKTHTINAVIHFAGFKSVGDSLERPFDYYSNNVVGTMVLVDAMRERGLKHLVFSSSANVYGNSGAVPISEDCPLKATNPYGRSKVMIEEILRDTAEADSSWRIALLRYFNPVGAHASGMIGEDPRGSPNNLMPLLAQVAAGQRKGLQVFGGDYPTHDGTGVRDYIHVVDLAQGHLAALRYLRHIAGCTALNLGTGNGHSVLDVLHAFERASGRTVPYKITERRRGDVAASYADTRLANRLLNWYATRELLEMCADAWRWQLNHAEMFLDARAGHEY